MYDRYWSINYTHKPPSFISIHPSLKMTKWVSLESVFQAPLLNATVALATMGFLHMLYRRYNRVSVSYIPGPAKSDPLFGNLTEIYFQEAGEPHIRWQEGYGQAFKIYGLLGVGSFQRSTVTYFSFQLDFSGRAPHAFRSQSDSTHLHEFTFVRPPETHSKPAQDALRAQSRSCRCRGS